MRLIRVLCGFLLLALTVLAILLPTAAPALAAAKKKPVKAAAPKPNPYPPCVFGLIPVSDGIGKPSGSGWTVSYNLVDLPQVAMIRKGQNSGAVIGIVQAGCQRKVPLQSPLRAPSSWAGSGYVQTLASDKVELSFNFTLLLRHWSGAEPEEWRKEPLESRPGMGPYATDDAKGAKPQTASFSSVGLGISGVPGLTWSRSTDGMQYLLCRGPIGRGLAVELRANVYAYGDGTSRLWDDDPAAAPGALQALAPYRQQARQVLMTMLNSLRWNSAAFAGLKPGPTVKPAPPTEGKLRLTVFALTSESHEIVEQARCTVQLPDKRELTGVTDAEGQVTFTLPLRDPKVPLRVTVTSVLADAATVYHFNGTRYPSRLRAGCPVIFSSGRTVDLKPATNFVGAEDIYMHLDVLNISVRQWNSVTKESSPVNLPVMIKNTLGKSVLQAEPDAYQAPGEMRLLIPLQVIWGYENLNIMAFDREVKDRRDSIIVPAPDPGESLSVLLEVNDLAWRIQRLRERLIAVFMPIVGIERASELANVRVTYVNEPGARYLDGVMQLARNFDPTDDGPSETLLHEWGHHIAAVLSPDPGVEDLVGQPGHELWVRAQNRETAWDEARAHFLAQELARALSMPRTNELAPARALGQAGRQPPGGGGQMEGIVATAMLDHYQRTGYGTPEKVLADFVAVEAAVRQQIGHPPRTVEEFLAGKLAYMDSRQDTPLAQRQDLSRLAERYRLLTEL